MKRYEHLKGYEFSACCVRSREIFGFIGQVHENDDPLELLPTAYFGFFPEDPVETQWTACYLGESQGADICATFEPKEKWCFVLKDGLVYTSGGGSGGWEKDIPDKTCYFTNVKSIRGGHAIAVGTNRTVYKRTGADTWEKLDNGFPTDDNSDTGKKGFLDIDGFSESDMYACGRNGDLWHYDGDKWQQISIPTDSILKKICCAKNGKVFIITDSRDVWVGNNNNWTQIKQDITREILEGIVDFDGKIIISTVSELLTIEDDTVKIWKPGIPTMKSKAHISSNDGILLVAGRDEACYFDGKRWTVFLEPE